MATYQVISERSTDVVTAKEAAREHILVGYRLKDTIAILASDILASDPQRHRTEYREGFLCIEKAFGEPTDTTMNCAKFRTESKEASIKRALKNNIKLYAADNLRELISLLINDAAISKQD